MGRTVAALAQSAMGDPARISYVVSDSASDGIERLHDQARRLRQVEQLYAPSERSFGRMVSPGTLPLPEQLRRDGRISTSSRPWMKGWDLAAWQAFRTAALALSRHRTREWIAEQLEISVKTLDDWMSPQGNSVPRFDKAWRLIGGLLSEEDRQSVGRYLAETLGLDVVGQAATKPDAAPLHLQAMEIGAAMGRVHHGVVAAMAANGDGGSAVTEAEIEGLMAAVGETYSQAGEMLVTLRAMKTQMAGKA